MREKCEYSDTPPRSDYHLTRSLPANCAPVLQALLEWGDKWAVAAPPIAIQHHDHPLRSRTVCATCGQPVRERDLRRVPDIPGLGHHRTSVGRARYQPADAAAVTTKLAGSGPVVSGPLPAHRASIAADVRVRERVPARRVTRQPSGSDQLAGYAPRVPATGRGQLAAVEA